MDRNLVVALLAVGRAWSLSARRAWIEIQISVTTVVGVLSLSARRAWIEILGCRIYDMSAAVALRKESVDRNADASKISKLVFGRSPQGERG